LIRDGTFQYEIDRSNCSPIVPEYCGMGRKYRKGQDRAENKLSIKINKLAKKSGRRPISMSRV
jgi:hypothetical protein